MSYTHRGSVEWSMKKNHLKHFVGGDIDPQTSQVDSDASIRQNALPNL